MAVFNGQTHLLPYLVKEFGGTDALLSLHDDQGNSALQLAKSRGYSQAIELLQCDGNDLRVLAKDIEESGSVEESSSEEDNETH